MNRLRSRPKKGFTIIEVLIVLAIAGIILLVVFRAIPALQRNQRNTGRKHFTEYVTTQVETFKGNTTIYPGDGLLNGADKRCELLQKYIDSSATCTLTSFPGGDCMKGDATLYSICFHDSNSSHEYFGEYDEISIELGHVCNNDTTSSELIIDAGTLSHSKYAVWTELEGGSIFCLDNE